MSNALLALLYSSASSASSSSSSTAAPASSSSSSAPAAPAPPPAHESTPKITDPFAILTGPPPASASSDAQASNLPSVAHQPLAPPRQLQPTASPAALSASNSLLALLTPPAQRANAAPAALPSPASPSAPLLSSSTPLQQPRPASASNEGTAPTANSLLSALLNPSSAPRTPQPKSPAPQSTAAPPAPPSAPPSFPLLSGASSQSQPAQQPAASQNESLPPLLQAILGSSQQSPAPSQALSSSGSKTSANDAVVPPPSQPEPAKDESAPAVPVPTVASEQTVAAPAESGEIPTSADTIPATENVLPNTLSSEPARQRESNGALPVHSGKKSREHLPVQRAVHQITKLTTTSGTSLADPRTSGLSALPSNANESHFHIDLTRLQPAGVNTLHRNPLQAVGISLFPQVQAQSQSSVPTATPKNLVATLPSPLSGSAGLDDVKSRNAAAIVLYNLSRARVRVVHRETGARVVLSPPTSSFPLSLNAKIVRLVTGMGPSRGGQFVVAAIVQDSPGEEAASARGEAETQFYLCAWGLPFDFGRAPHESVPPKTESQVLLMTLLPDSAESRPPSLTFEVDHRPGIGDFGSLLLTTTDSAKRTAQLWRVDIDRCEGRTGFPLENLRKGRGALLLSDDLDEEAETLTAEARSAVPLTASVGVNAGRSSAKILLRYEMGSSSDACTFELPLRDWPTSFELPQTHSAPSFFCAIAGDHPDSQWTAIVAWDQNTHVAVVRCPRLQATSGPEGPGRQYAEVIAYWHFDGPTELTSETASNLLAIESASTQMLVLAQPERSSIFVLPLQWATTGKKHDVSKLRWTECAVPEPITDFVLDAIASEETGSSASTGIDIEMTASYSGGVHVVKISKDVLDAVARLNDAVSATEEPEIAPYSDEVTAESSVPAEELPKPSEEQPSNTPIAAVAEAIVKKVEETPEPLPTLQEPVAETAEPTAKTASSAELTASKDATVAPPNGSSTLATPASAPAPASPAVPAPAAQTVSSPVPKSRAAKVAQGESTKAGNGSARSRTSSQAKKEDVALAAAKGNVSGSGQTNTNIGSGTGSTGAANVDIGPVMSLLKQQINQVVIPEVKTSTKQAVQEYMGNTLPEAVLAALPHELHRFLLRPDLSAHLIRTISSGVLPNVQKTAVDTVTRVLAPEFEEMFSGVENRLLEAVESEMVNLRKDVVAEQGEAMLQTEGLVKEMSARMAELRSAVLGLNAANARMEKVLIRMAERSEQREAEHGAERQKLFELIALQQRKLDGLDGNFTQHLDRYQTALDEHRGEIRVALSSQQQQRRGPPGPDEWGAAGHRGSMAPSILSPPPAPPTSQHHHGMLPFQGPPGSDWYGPPPPSAGSGSFPPLTGPGFSGPPGPPWSSAGPPPPPPPSAGPPAASHPPHRAVPEQAEEALIQALGAPNIEQDASQLKDTLHTLYARHGSIPGVIGEPGVNADSLPISQPVLLALVHRLAMALDARARLGPSPPPAVVLAGTAGALETSLAVPWLEAAAPLLNPRNPQIEKQYLAVVTLIREALWRAVQGLRGGPDSWWDEKRAKEHLLNYLWIQR
ncbi:kynurenine 3-monooxygenase, mitochondrial precursor [Tilletia horrida]|nr:kynurenine 3-monooxygenase, mitochondrial precursor [Tilletia horrida]